MIHSTVYDQPYLGCWCLFDLDVGVSADAVLHGSSQVPIHPAGNALLLLRRVVRVARLPVGPGSPFLSGQQVASARSPAGSSPTVRRCNAPGCG